MKIGLKVKLMAVVDRRGKAVGQEGEMGLTKHWHVLLRLCGRLRENGGDRLRPCDHSKNLLRRCWLRGGSNNGRNR